MDRTRDSVTQGVEEDDTLRRHRDNIEDARARITADVDEIGRRLNPSELTSQAVESAKDAVTAAPRNVVDRIRANPVPALMIAGGIGWLLFGGSGRSSRRGSSYMGASTYSTGGYRSRYGTGERSDYPSDSRDFSNRVGSMSGHLSDAVDQAVGSAQDMTDRAAQLPDQAGEMMSSGVDRARGAIEANPLGAAVVAAGLGAAVGLLLPSTRGEQRIFGDARERVVEAAGDKVQELGEKAQTVAQTAADAAKDKAKQEGLTQPAQSSSGRQSTSQSRPGGSSRPNPPTTAAPGPSTLPPQTS